MFRNYLKTAPGSLYRNKNYNLINIAGSTAGIAMCMIIISIITFQNSFDNLLTGYHYAEPKEIFFGPGVLHPMPQGPT